MSKDTNTPAFPHVNPSFDDNWNKERQVEGMSMRAYIATKCCAAMVGTIRNDGDYTRLCHIAQAHDLDKVSQFFAREAVKQADALIAELERDK